MNRSMCSITLSLLVLAPFTFAQELQSSADEDTLASRQLIAWTWMQKPQPTPQPIPPPDKGIPQPDQQTEHPSSPQQHQEEGQPQTQIFTGKIMRDGETYVLKSPGTTYQLSAQSNMQQFQGQDVKIIGTLDAGSNTIHVTKVRLIS